MDFQKIKTMKTQEEFLKMFVNQDEDVDEETEDVEEEVGEEDEFDLEEENFDEEDLTLEGIEEQEE